jgi:serine/threonine protein kinase
MPRMSSKPQTSPAEGAPDTVFDPLMESAAGTGRALVPGTMLEEYEIQRVLSESGFAVVYLAMDHAFDRLVVIKEYQPSTLAEHSEKSRAELRGPVHATAFKRGKYAFMSESRMLASCDHPSLLRVNRIWDANGTVYRVMPYYYGKSLQATRQAAIQAPDEASLRSLLDGLLGALSALHEQDCVHGAVSPDNILLLADDRPVLMDFGAVRRAIVSTETQRLIAMLEPSYLPLEQIEPAPPELVPGPWSDLYSVAAVLYFCIAGDLPKRGKREPISVVARKLQARQPGLHYSAALLHAIDSALAENLADRPRNVAEFRRLLDTPRVAPVADATAPLTEPVSSQAAQGASFPASDDMVNIQGRVVPFARRKETGMGRPPAPSRHQAPSAPERRPWGLGTTATATAFQPDDGDAAEAASNEGSASRFYPSLQEMMDESDERLVADMRRERANNQFPDSAPIRPQANRPRMMIGLAVLLLLGLLGFVGWKLNEQRQADAVLSSVGNNSNNSASPVASATPDATPFPPPMAATDTPAVATPPVPAPAVDNAKRPVTPGANTATAAATARPAGASEQAPPPLVDMREPPAAVEPPSNAKPRGEMPMAPPSAGRPASTSTLPALPPVQDSPAAKPVREPLTAREACGDRVDFALYNCMQTQCARGRWSASLQCQRLRDTDEVMP